MSNPSFALVHSDDWSGLYVDGKLVYEDHNIDVDTFLELIEEHKGIILDIARLEADGEWLYEQGRLPDDLNEVKIEEQ